MIAPILMIVSGIIGAAASKNKYGSNSGGSNSGGSNSGGSNSGGSNSGGTATKTPYVAPSGLIPALNETPPNTLVTFTLNKFGVTSETLNWLLQNHYITAKGSDTPEITMELKAAKNSPGGRQALYEFFTIGKISLRELREALGLPFYVNVYSQSDKPNYKAAQTEYLAKRDTLEDFANKVMIVGDWQISPEMAEEKKLIQQAIFDVIGTQTIIPGKSPLAGADAYQWNLSPWFKAREGQFFTLNDAKKALYNAAHIKKPQADKYVTYDQYTYPFVEKLAGKKLTGEQDMPVNITQIS
jgi:hypothetical protein